MLFIVNRPSTVVNLVLRVILPSYPPILTICLDMAREPHLFYRTSNEESSEFRGNIFAAMIVYPPRHLVWSTDSLDLSDPFQKRWLLRQTLMHGRAEDIRALNIEEIRLELDQLDLPQEIESLWRLYLEYLDAGSH